VDGSREAIVAKTETKLKHHVEDMIADIVKGLG